MVRSLKKADLIFLIIAGLYLLVSLYRLQDIPPPWFDEIVHLNAAKHLAEEGRIWCDFYTPKFKGVMFNGMPLHWILLGVYVKLFGVSLAGARLFYVLLSILTLFVVYIFAKKIFDEKAALLSSLLLASCYIFFHNSRQIMPQVPAALFSTTAILLFYTAREKGSNLLFAMAGFASALAYLSHPTGLGIFFIILALFFYKKIPVRFFFLYLAVTFLTIVPYIIYVAANFQEYVRQTVFIVKGLYPNQNIFLNMLDEIPVRYFGLPPAKYLFLKKIIDGKTCVEYFYMLIWGAQYLDLRIYLCEMASKAPFILSLFYLGFKKNNTENQKDIFLIALLYIIFESFHPNKFGPYTYLVVPYLALCVSVSYYDLINRKTAVGYLGIRRIIGTLILAVFLVSNLLLIYKELATKRIAGYDGFIREVSNRIPKGSTVAAPMYFWVGMHNDYVFISAAQIVYEIEEAVRNEIGDVKFRDIPLEEQEALIKKILTRHKIQYVLITCHWWDNITEVPGSAEGMGRALRRYLFYNADKITDLLRGYYYEDLPPPARFEDEVYDQREGRPGFCNVSEEYQKSLKIYRMR